MRREDIKRREKGGKKMGGCREEGGYTVKRKEKGGKKMGGCREERGYKEEGERREDHGRM